MPMTSLPASIATPPGLNRWRSANGGYAGQYLLDRWANFQPAPPRPRTATPTPVTITTARRRRARGWSRMATALPWGGAGGVRPAVVVVGLVDVAGLGDERSGRGGSGTDAPWEVVVASF